MALTFESRAQSSVTAPRVALLVVDVINDFDSPEGDALLALASEALPRIEALIDRARRFELPIVYVNDNFGLWRTRLRPSIKP